MHVQRTLLVDSCVVLTVLLLLLTLQAKSSEAGLMHICRFHQRRPHPNGLCGRRLPMVLAGLCHRFIMLMRSSAGGKHAGKRAVQGLDMGPEFLKDDENQKQLLLSGMTDLSPDGGYSEGLEKIFLEKKSALGYLEKRQESGDIVCECCYHQCSVLELVQYCDLPADL